ncbi:MAG: hypothetical protein IJ442_05035 [Bacteroidaceae bacterium]|nr:hypothetical protein [Bacteroidaceae bacterium]
MKKIIFIAVAAIMLCSCSTPKLANTVWCTINGVSQNGYEAMEIESIYFLENGEASFCRSIADKDGIIVAPYKFASATYKTKGSLKKEASISVDYTKNSKDTIFTNGVIDVNKKILMLHNPSDSSVTVYIKNPNVVIE